MSFDKEAFFPSIPVKEALLHMEELIAARTFNAIFAAVLKIMETIGEKIREVQKASSTGI